MTEPDKNCLLSLTTAFLASEGPEGARVLLSHPIEERRVAMERALWAKGLFVVGYQYSDAAMQGEQHPLPTEARIEAQGRINATVARFQQSNL